MYEKIALEIIVDDVNDNAPRFSKKSVSVEISESVLPKDRIEAKGEKKFMTLLNCEIIKLLNFLAMLKNERIEKFLPNLSPRTPRLRFRRW